MSGWLAYTEAEEPYIAYDVMHAYNKNYVLSRINGLVYELSMSTYTDAGYKIARERITAPLNSSALKIDGRRLKSNGAELIMETGIGNTDQPNPLVMMAISTDGGQSFSNEFWAKGGRNSENAIRVLFNYVKNAYRCNLKLGLHTLISLISIQ